MTEFQILQDRLTQVMGWSLKHGAHKKNDNGDLCVMEAVAYVAGRPWSDSPPCVLLVKRMCELTDLPNGYFMRAV